MVSENACITVRDNHVGVFAAVITAPCGLDMRPMSGAVSIPVIGRDGTQTTVSIAANASATAGIQLPGVTVYNNDVVIESDLVVKGVAALKGINSPTLSPDADYSVYEQR